MGDLQPIGSEKLHGEDKIKRILEIAMYKEARPNSINETSKSEYKLTLADGREYEIVREKAGYVIKHTISESESEYLSPIQDRVYFKSYSQALRRLNLMAKEMNEKYQNDGGVSLFGEQKRFTLKVPDSMKKQPEPMDDVENVPPPPAPASDSAVPAAPAPDMGGEMAPELPPPGDEVGMEDDLMGEPDDEVVTFKMIQKLTGRLAQKLRLLNSEEENKMDSKDIKYVINSVLSALELDRLDETDKDDIVNKLEGTEDEFGLDEPVSGDEESEIPEPEIEPEGGEVGESDSPWVQAAEEAADVSLMKSATSRFGGDTNEEDENTGHLKKIADSVFMEAKVEDVLMNDFTITENEKKFNDKLIKEREAERKKAKIGLHKEIKRLSESAPQEFGARKFANQNPNAVFVGKTNKNNLVFELNDKQVKISTTGKVL